MSEQVQENTSHYWDAGVLVTLQYIIQEQEINHQIEWLIKRYDKAIKDGLLTNKIIIDQMENIKQLYIASNKKEVD